MTSPRPARRTAPAFTLVELLVVIAVIALLIGILVPAIGAARGAAKASACMSNMRSLGQATLGYTQDHNLTFPQPFTEGQLPTEPQKKSALWFNALDRYLGQQVKSNTTAAGDRNYDVYKQDPVWLELPQAVKSGPTFVQMLPENVRTIKMNDFFGESRGPGNAPPAPFGVVNFVRLLDIPEPARTVLFADGRAHDTRSTTTGNADVGSAGNFSLIPTAVALRHGDGANLSFADGAASYQENPIQISATGYRGWFDPYAAGVTPDQYADNIFRFQPERFKLDRIRARGGGV